MLAAPIRVWLTSFLVTAGVTGLLNPAHLLADDKEDVTRTFKAFQAALKAKDAAKIYALLDNASQKAANTRALFIKAAYNKASAAQKAKWEKSLGLPGTELAKLTGQGFLKTKRFQAKYDEVPGSKIQKITVQEDRATVFYIEPDEDKEKLQLNREKGKWKISAPMPQVGKP
jgi:hypothetical protein